MVLKDHTSSSKIRDKDLQKPSRNIHIMEVLYDQGVVNPVKGLGEINESEYNSIGNCLVNSCMDEVEKSD